MKLTVNAPTNVRIKRGVNHYVKAWRLHRGLSVDKLGKLADISGSMISQLERGLTSYSQTTLEKLATALVVKPWQLLACGPEENRVLWESVLAVGSHGIQLDDYSTEDQTHIRRMLSNNCEAVAKSAGGMFTKTGA